MTAAFRHVPPGPGLPLGTPPGLRGLPGVVDGAVYCGLCHATNRNKDCRRRMTPAGST